MSYLNPQYPNNFQELCAAMPLFYLDVFEMRAILRAQGHLLDGVCSGVENVVDFNFILTADDATIRMWEKALKITYKGKLTLDQRKRVVIGYIIGLGHIGEPEIRGIIGQYTPGHVDFDFMRGTITVVVEGEIPGEENLLETLLRRIPAHLTTKIYIHIRKQYRHTIPFSQGGAVGSYFLFEPVTQGHITDTMPLPFSQAAAVTPRLTGIPPAPAETVRTDLPLSHGGKFRSELAGDTPAPEQTVRTRYKLWQGGTSTSDMAGDTPQVQRTARKPVNVAQGAFDRPGITTDTPEHRGASTSREKAAGGLFCHTHIKSKRID